MPTPQNLPCAASETLAGELQAPILRYQRYTAAAVQRAASRQALILLKLDEAEAKAGEADKCVDRYEHMCGGFPDQRMRS